MQGFKRVEKGWYEKGKITIAYEDRFDKAGWYYRKESWRLFDWEGPFKRLWIAMEESQNARKKP